MWPRTYFRMMVERNCWTLFMVVSSNMSKVFVSTCENVWGTLRPLRTLVMKGPIMLSNLVLSVCFHSMKSAKIQLDTDCYKFDLYCQYLVTFLLRRATWSTSFTINDITLAAEFMLKFAIYECENFASWRISNDKWLLVRSVEREVHSLIPRIYRVYTITMHAFEDCGCPMCDCNYFESNGMVCQHFVRVKMYYAAKSVVSHHDISVPTMTF